MAKTLAQWSERGISAFKYLLSAYMIVAGMAIIIGPLDTTTTLGFLYASRLSLVIIGACVVYSGTALLYGKVRKSKRWTGHGLFCIYLCFLFAAILNYVAYSGDWTFWLGNLIAALITGALWLRWKFKTEYINPRHFIRDIDKLKD